ncbi:MAG: GNAT family N-acetyltransferase [Clostridiales bacterium]|nr:GNAT family N-acetyltransferase [Clostridiales bacterium]
MLYLKPLNYEDREQEYRFFRETPGENGFENHCRRLSYPDFVETALPRLLDNARGIGLAVGRVPETLFFLWEDGQIVGLFKVRHRLNQGLRTGSGHIGYAVHPAFRGRGYATRGLELAVEECKRLLPPEETELYLSCSKANPASLRVMLKNGAYLHHYDRQNYYLRIPLNRAAGPTETTTKDE